METQLTVPKPPPTGLIIAGGLFLLIIGLFVLFYINRGSRPSPAPTPVVQSPGPSPAKSPGPPLAPAVNYDDIMSQAGDPLLKGVVDKYW
jgi:hypothetical protein